MCCSLVRRGLDGAHWSEGVVCLDGVPSNVHDPEFADVTKKDGEVKPIVLTFVDGGPDENPRFPKTLDVAIDHFRYYLK